MPELPGGLTAARLEAQIPGVFRVYVSTVRSIYLLTVVCALVIGGWAFLELVLAFLRQGGSVPPNTQSLLAIGFLLAYFGPAFRAAIRLVRYRQLVPDANLRERPVVATLVTIPAMLGFLLFYLVLHVWIGIMPWGDEDVGGPMGGALFLALLFHVFALLTGEIVLVGRTTDTRRALAPFTGNGV